MSSAKENVRAVAKASIERLYARMEAGDFVVEGVTIEFKVATLDNLEAHYNRFVDAHLELIAEAEAAAIAGQSEIFDAVEERYTVVRAYLRDLVHVETVHNQSVHEDSATRIHVQSHDLRLEKIGLPEFNGEFHKWLAFRDMFEAMVHNQHGLTVAAKYTRLMKALKGEAAQVVAGFLPTDDNYEEAWSTLKSRYDNNRLIINSHLAIFLNMDSLPKESNTGLRRMVDITKQTTRSLKAMKRPVEHWDDLLIHIVISKLPRETVVDWEKQQKRDKLPTLDDLLALLEGRARGLDHMTAGFNEKSGRATVNNHSPNSKSATATKNAGGQTAQKMLRSNVAAPAKGQCHYCEGPHHVGRCPKLQAIPAADRFGKVKGSRLCYNCLYPGHLTANCSSTANCFNCGGRHHTILCRSTTQSVANTSNNGNVGNNDSSGSSSNQQA